MSKKEEFAPKPEEKGELKIESPQETAERLSAEYREQAVKKVDEVQAEAKEGTEIVKKEGGSEQQVARIEGAGGKLKTAVELAMEKEKKKITSVMAGRSGKEESKQSEVIKEEEEAMAAERLIREKIEVRKRAEIAKRERYGVEDRTVKNLISNVIGKGALNTIGSVFGFRLAWEAPKLLSDHFKKKEQKKEISKTTFDLLQKAQIGEKARKGERPKKEKVESVEIGKGLVAQKIKELNKKLKETKMSFEDKKGLRSEFARTLREYKRQGKNLEEAKIEKIGKSLDLYINTSEQKMVVAREAVNTVSIMAFMPWLRLVGYSVLAGAERAVKAANSFEKKHFREKEGLKKRFGEAGFLAKNLTIDAAKEQLHGLTLNFFNKEQKGKIQKGAEFASSVFMLLRVAGLLEFEKALQSGSLQVQEGAKKFWENLENGNLAGVLKQGGENWVNNAQRLLSYVGLAENPNQAMQKLVVGETPQSGTKSGKSVFDVMAEEKGKEQEAKGLEIAKQARAEWESKTERIKDLATIKKGEGIEHAFIRQIENNPQVFGYKGDPNNVLEVHRFAQSKAHLFAIKNELVNPKTGEEIRVLYDAKTPSGYILKPDGLIEKVNPHEYTWKPHEETKEILQKSLTAVNTPQEIEARKALEEELAKRRPAAVNTPQEIASRKALEEELAKHRPAAINTPQEIYERQQITPEIMRHNFIYDQSGVITEWRPQANFSEALFKTLDDGTYKELSKLVLKDNWKEFVRGKIDTDELMAIEKSVAELGLVKKHLEIIKDTIGVNSPEYSFLERWLDNWIYKDSKKYGDIFKIMTKYI